MNPVVLVVGCHPDDIEFLMGGTCFLLKEAGCSFHYINVASGHCGTSTLSPSRIAKIRREEAQNAAAFLGSSYYPPFTGDLEVFYTQKLIRKLVGVIREVEPDIILALSPQDYMEDHMNTCRISVTAAFCRGMRNYYSIPKRKPVFKDVVLYHAMPYGLTDWVKTSVTPHFYLDIGTVLDKKEGMLACHKSQKVWLDESQGLDSYLISMRDMSAQVGSQSGKFEYAEGWRVHSHLGFSAMPMNPIQELLSTYYLAADD